MYEDEDGIYVIANNSKKSEDDVSNATGVAIVTSTGVIKSGSVGRHCAAPNMPDNDFHDSSVKLFPGKMTTVQRWIEVTCEDELGVIVIERLNIDLSDDAIKTIEEEYKSRGLKVLKVDFCPLGKGLTKVKPYEVAKTKESTVPEVTKAEISTVLEPEKEKNPNFCSTPEKEAAPILNYRASLSKTPRKPLRRPFLLSHGEHEAIRRRNEDSGIKSFGSGVFVNSEYVVHASERTWEADETFKSEESTCECGTQTIGESKVERLSRYRRV